MPGGNRSRITLEQRRLMLDFIKQNPAMVTGRFDGPEGSKLRTNLLKELANILNGQGSGATKTPEKWLRSWQDWKSDTKRKAEINRQAQGTDQSTCTALSELERDLVNLIEETSRGGLNIAKPNSVSGPSKSEKVETKVQELKNKRQLIDDDPVVIVSTDNVVPTLINEPQRKCKKRKILKSPISMRVVSAIERQADANAEVARQIGRLADVGLMFLRTWAKMNNVDTEVENSD